MMGPNARIALSDLEDVAPVGSVPGVSPGRYVSY